MSHMGDHTSSHVLNEYRMSTVLSADPINGFSHPYFINEEMLT